MSTKILRKELELTLIKTIEDVLTKVNVGAAKKVNKSTREASKTIAKKFFKTIKSDAKVKKTPSKAIVKKAVVTPKKEGKAPTKKLG